jgi:hypothetical protein
MTRGRLCRLRDTAAVLEILALVAAFFWVAPLVVGMFLGWGTVLYLTQYDAWYSLEVAAIIALAAYERFKDLEKNRKRLVV